MKRMTLGLLVACLCLVISACTGAVEGKDGAAMNGDTANKPTTLASEGASPMPSQDQRVTSSPEATPTPTPEHPFRQAPKEIYGYLPLWSSDCYKTLDYENLTHINLAFINPDETGALTCDATEETVRAIVDKAHAEGVKVLMSMGGAGNSANYPPLIADEAPRKAFVARIGAYVDKYGLDGIDLDIEGDADPLFWSCYEPWVEALRVLCDEKGILLTTAVGNWYADRISEKTYAWFDRVGIMAYDNDMDTMHSTFQYAKDCIGYFSVLRKLPKEKLLLGVPFYGRGYDANGKLDWNSYMSYRDLLALDPEAGSKDESHGYGYNGIETLKQKCDIARDCAGMMIWELSQDADGEASLLRVMRAALP